MQSEIVSRSDSRAFLLEQVKRIETEMELSRPRREALREVINMLRPKKIPRPAVVYKPFELKRTFSKYVGGCKTPEEEEVLLRKLGYDGGLFLSAPIEQSEDGKALLDKLASNTGEDPRAIINRHFNVAGSSSDPSADFASASEQRGASGSSSSGDLRSPVGCYVAASQHVQVFTSPVVGHTSSGSSNEPSPDSVGLTTAEVGEQVEEEEGRDVMMPPATVTPLPLVAVDPSTASMSDGDDEAGEGNSEGNSEGKDVLYGEHLGAAAAGTTAVTATTVGTAGAKNAAIPPGSFIPVPVVPAVVPTVIPAVVEEVGAAAAAAVSEVGPDPLINNKKRSLCDLSTENVIYGKRTRFGAR